ncbi:MAG: oxidoreductase coenzyme F420-dependent [Frankiales bacterium]|jgi:NADPH-dependent F420 reductase|nr:oxidoreductase coenzyme F420-dependent [Frankiales bacterium]
MKIAIIGVGNVGGGLAAAATKAGHDVVVAASNPASAAKSAADTGAVAAASSADAVQGADAVVLAVPHGAVAQVVADLAGALDGKTVVDATNPLNDSYTDLTTTGVSAAEALQQQIPGAKVVKALNTVFASRYANPSEDGRPLHALIAGDDAAAKATVSRLVESLGFRPVDAGSLRFARSLEEIAFLNISLNAANGWTWQSHFALVGPTAAQEPR